MVANHLHIPRRFQSEPEELEGEELLMAVARDSMYLLELANILKTGLDHAVKRVTQSIMESTSTFTAPTNIVQ